jgi:TetR/AcrR family transcriptional repressor of nem operon
MRTFWQKGYEGTSMVDLLEATNLSKSSLYGAFGGKRELFLKAFDSYREERSREMWESLKAGSGRMAIERFFRSVVAGAKAGDPRGCMSINQAVEMAPHDPDVRQRVASDFREISEALASAVDRGRADGSIKSSRCTGDLVKLMVLAFPGLQVLARAGCDDASLEDGLTAVLSMLD